MSVEYGTHVCMGGFEVTFVKWTPNGLIYTRAGSQDTVAHLSRGTVRRLLREGTLTIDGYRPEWAYISQSDSDDA